MLPIAPAQIPSSATKEKAQIFIFLTKLAKEIKYGFADCNNILNTSKRKQTFSILNLLLRSNDFVILLIQYPIAILLDPFFPEFCKNK